MGVNIIKEGIDIGIKEGSKESKLEIARAMVKKNMDINLIAEITNLPVEEIKTLKQAKKYANEWLQSRAEQKNKNGTNRIIETYT